MEYAGVSGACNAERHTSPRMVDGRQLYQTDLGSGFKVGAWKVSRESLKSFAPALLTARRPTSGRGVLLALFTRHPLCPLLS